MSRFRSGTRSTSRTILSRLPRLAARFHLIARQEQSNREKGDALTASPFLLTEEDTDGQAALGKFSGRYHISGLNGVRPHDILAWSQRSLWTPFSQDGGKSRHTEARRS